VAVPRFDLSAITGLNLKKEESRSVHELTKSQKGRLAIRSFVTIADALALRGYYKPSGQSGLTLETALREINPEIFATMNDPRCIELKGLEYVIDRLPRGIENGTRLILTAQEELTNTTFEEIVPLKRRRVSYRIGDNQFCFVISRGWSEMYDILTHITFLNIEANKIYQQIHDANGNTTVEWKAFEANVLSQEELSSEKLDKAIWNLSMVLGRTYQETLQTYNHLESNRKESNSNTGLFNIIYGLGKRVHAETKNVDDRLTVTFTPAFRDIVGQHRYSSAWAQTVKDKIQELGLDQRPLHIISANMHSVVNAIYGFAAVQLKDTSGVDFCQLIRRVREKQQAVYQYGKQFGLTQLPDRSGTHIDCQIIDCVPLASVPLHPEFRINREAFAQKPVILVIDYAFGIQAFEVMDELLNPSQEDTSTHIQHVHSISVMGKAGTLPGKKGDIMLATSHVFEGTPHNYQVENDLCQADFDPSVCVYAGPMVTVMGTSLQNRDVLSRFHISSWSAIGLEMEGGHYQRAISAAMIRGHISKEIKIRYAYYASDNPLYADETLASGSMGEAGIRPTYLITKAIIEKILK